MISRGGLQMRSGVSAGDLRLRFASRTSSGLMELSFRPTMPIRVMTRCLVGVSCDGDGVVVVSGDDDCCNDHPSDDVGFLVFGEVFVSIGGTLVWLFGLVSSL